MEKVNFVLGIAALSAIVFVMLNPRIKEGAIADIGLSSAGLGLVGMLTRQWVEIDSFVATQWSAAMVLGGIDVFAFGLLMQWRTGKFLKHGR